MVSWKSEEGDSIKRGMRLGVMDEKDEDRSDEKRRMR